MFYFLLIRKAEGRETPLPFRSTVRPPFCEPLICDFSILWINYYFPNDRYPIKFIIDSVNFQFYELFLISPQIHKNEVWLYFFFKINNKENLFMILWILFFKKDKLN